MEWVKNDEGNISVNALLDYTVAFFANEICLIRFELATSLDQVQVNPMIVQMTMSLTQSEQLVSDLQKMIAQIHGAPSRGLPN